MPNQSDGRNGTGNQIIETHKSTEEEDVVLMEALSFNLTCGGNVTSQGADSFLFGLIE